MGMPPDRPRPVKPAHIPILHHPFRSLPTRRLPIHPPLSINLPLVGSLRPSRPPPIPLHRLCSPRPSAGILGRNGNLGWLYQSFYAERIRDVPAVLGRRPAAQWRAFCNAALYQGFRERNLFYWPLAGRCRGRPRDGFHLCKGREEEVIRLERQGKEKTGGADIGHPRTLPRKFCFPTFFPFHLDPKS
jgi:hypothetical protein